MTLNSRPGQEQVDHLRSLRGDGLELEVENEGEEEEEEETEEEHRWVCTGQQLSELHHGVCFETIYVSFA